MQQEHLSPPRPDPPMTYDEASMQGSRHFFMALQELKNLRPQLYSAAEYCESSYLFNDQKQVVLENLKDYTVKAIVNAVDHLGTVAYKLDEVLSQQISEISTAELRIAGLSQRMRACQEHRDVEGFSQQRPAKLNRQYHKHYLLPDVMPGYKDHFMENVEDKMREPQIVHSQQDNNARTLSWHLAADSFTPRKGLRPAQQAASRFLGGNMHESTSSGSSSAPSEHVGPSSNLVVGLASSSVVRSEYRAHGQALSMDSFKPPSSHSSFDEKFSPQHSPVASRSKSLLASLLGRRRSVKQRS
ncbi:hypothetical protein KP509_12G022000 [Ceratopteris richardii]|uniref:Uncharacterized protein n=1 Tax=Ceratopteris richardii TaxID=49495 RepID=A0A8T2TJU3_CERRI|nr:hypothetical protein KP509_12G022000 [Ceratopteris richardii]KAH7422720.1 hypothetical protein KP509_12G022000 [Ceratopteris richardii]